jgi:hypothetical protein
MRGGDIKRRRQALSVLGLLWQKAPEPVLGLVWPLVAQGTACPWPLVQQGTKRPVLCLVSDKAQEAKDRHTSQYGAAVSMAHEPVWHTSQYGTRASMAPRSHEPVWHTSQYGTRASMAHEPLAAVSNASQRVSRYRVACLINSLSPPFSSQPLSLHADCEAGRGGPR